GISEKDTFQVHDQLAVAGFRGGGRAHCGGVDAAQIPAAVYGLRRGVRPEQDFDYFMYGMALPSTETPTSAQPMWYRNAVIYQAHVRSFYDSDGNGIGDFRGVTQKLDYLQDLGISALWLLPFYPSPLRDDGYDIADYYAINPIYGMLDDFKDFLSEAHRRTLRVITVLVIILPS